MRKADQLQTQICKLDQNLETVMAQFESRKIDVIDYTNEMDKLIEQQAALTSEVANLRLEDFKRGEV